MTASTNRRHAVAEFEGFQRPNFTQVPHLFFDLVPSMPGRHIKVLLYVMRRTFGFKKATDRISISQFLRGITTREGKQLDRGCGLGKEALLAALRELAETGYLVSTAHSSPERGNESTEYGLNLAPKTNNPATGLGDFAAFLPTTLYVPVPDEVFDVLLPDLNGTDLKVLLFIVRRTLGVGRPTAAIGKREMAEGLRTPSGNGPSEEQIKDSLRKLKDHNVIVVDRQKGPEGADRANQYRLNVLRRQAEEGSQQVTSDGGPKSTKGGVQIEPRVGAGTGPRGGVTSPPGLGAIDTPPTGGENRPHKRHKPTEEQEGKQQDSITGEERNDVVVALVQVGVTKAVALEMLRRYPLERIVTQLEMLAYRKADNAPALLVKAIERDWAPPPGYGRQCSREAPAQDEAEPGEQWERPIEDRSEATGSPPPAPMTGAEDTPFRPFANSALDSRQAWATALMQLHREGGAAAYLRGSRLLDREGDQVVVSVHTTYAAQWLNRRLASQAARVLSALGGELVTVRFVSPAAYRS